MASADSSEFECPVCYNLFKNPKFLPCYHLVCRDCVLSWLQKTGGRGECPICRAPILSAAAHGKRQLKAQIDRLQTDVATQALADGHKILAGPHQCDMCPDNVAGQDFCLQCSIKLCTSCTLYHQKLPATAQHTVQQLSTLTVGQLAARHHVKCKAHRQQLAELYCAKHVELICLRCASSTHHGCPEAKEIEAVAKEERRKLKDQLEGMKAKEGELAEQVNAVKEKLKAMRKKVNDVFDDLSHSVEKRRSKLNELIQAEDDAMMASLAEVEKARVSTGLPCRNIENLVMYSPDDSLLDVLRQLTTRLDKIESQMKVKHEIRDMRCLVLEDHIITRLKSDLENLGRIEQPQRQPTATPAAGPAPRTSDKTSGQTQQSQRQPASAEAAPRASATNSGREQQPQPQLTSTPTGGASTASGQKHQPQRQLTSAPVAGAATASGPTTAARPQGAALARVLKVGDRVKLAPGLSDWGVQPGQLGTVTAIPSKIVAAGGLDSQGMVDVRWDRAGEYCHCMGRGGSCDLVLA